MNLPSWAREYATVDLTLDSDPGSDTVELQIDDTWYGMDWIGTAVQTGTTWARSARLLVAGPDATSNPTGTVVLTLGRHATAWRLTDNPEIVGTTSDPIFVG